MSPRELIAKWYSQAEARRDASPPPKSNVRRSNTTNSVPAMEAEDYFQPPSYRMRSVNSF